MPLDLAPIAFCSYWIFLLTKSVSIVYNKHMISLSSFYLPASSNCFSYLGGPTILVIIFVSFLTSISLLLGYLRIGFLISLGANSLLYYPGPILFKRASCFKYALALVSFLKTQEGVFIFTGDGSFPSLPLVEGKK